MLVDIYLFVLALIPFCVQVLIIAIVAYFVLKKLIRYAIQQVKEQL